MNALRRRAARLASALAFVALSGAARADVSWPEIEPLIRAQLAREGSLSAADAERLLGDPRVRAGLVAAFSGWDGADDAVAVIPSREGLEVQVRIATRRVVCTASVAGEGQASVQRCAERVVTDAFRRTALARSLWAPQPRPKPPTRAARARPEAPGAPAAAPEGPVETVLRRLPGLGDAARAHRPEVHAALVDYARFLDTLRGPHWRDPMLPASALEAGVALRAPATPAPPVEPAAMAGLRDPFGEGRLGGLTELPVPDLLRLGHPQQEPAVTAPTPECLEQWAVREGSDRPPELECFRQVAHTARLERSPAYQVAHALGALGLGVSLPLLDQLLALEAADAASHKAHLAVWALAWLDWVERQPTRFAEAARDLTAEERGTLRRRLWRWWVDPGLAPLHDRITRLYEQHFLVLYPEARDAAGMPRRSFFDTTWLWATNWLSEADRLPVRAVVAAYERLGERERAVLDDFVLEPMLAERFPSPCEALRSHE